MTTVAKTKRLIHGAMLLWPLLISMQAQAGDPSAIVESASVDLPAVAPFQYLEPGREIELPPNASIVLGYLRSCLNETITGGRVVIGAERSDVSGGKVVRRRVECDSGQLEISPSLAAKSGAVVFRKPPKGSSSTLPNASITVYSTTPTITIAGASKHVILQRVDRDAPALDLKVVDGVADFARQGRVLEPGAIYAITAADRQVIFKVDPLAVNAGPLLARLLRL